MPTSPRGLMHKPPLKGEGDQRSWWRGSSVQYNFSCNRVETVRRNSLVPRCPPWACQRRLLPLPVSVVLIFRRFLVQAGDFYFYGVCKFAFLGSPLGHPKGVPCAELSPQVTEGYFRKTSHIKQKIPQRTPPPASLIPLPFQGRLFYIQAPSFILGSPERGAVTAGD